jgi:hypothetical protein
MKQSSVPDLGSGMENIQIQDKTFRIRNTAFNSTGKGIVLYFARN